MKERKRKNIKERKSDKLKNIEEWKGRMNEKEKRKKIKICRNEKKVWKKERINERRKVRVRECKRK